MRWLGMILFAGQPRGIKKAPTRQEFVSLTGGNASFYDVSRNISYSITLHCSIDHDMGVVESELTIDKDAQFLTIFVGVPGIRSPTFSWRILMQRALQSV